jgi:hypothetical protein
MQTTTITTTTPTQITLNNTIATTVKQWYNAALPTECAAIATLISKPNGLKGLNPRVAILAVTAHTIKTFDALSGLHPNTANDLMGQLSIRTLQTEIIRNELGAPNRAAAAATVLNAGLKNKLRQISLLYLGAGTKNYSDADADFLLNACLACVLDDFKTLSIEEIELAFKYAADTDFKAYGALNVQLLSQVLTAYKTRRNALISAVIDEANKIKGNIEHLQTVADKNHAAYVAELAELRALQVENTKHQRFHTCPTHWVKKFLEDGVLIVQPEEKKAIFAEARAHLAYDLLNEAPNLAARKSLAKYIETVGIVPVPSGRIIASDVLRMNLSPAFDYKNCDTAFPKHAEIYYAKKIYFYNLPLANNQ